VEDLMAVTAEPSGSVTSGKSHPREKTTVSAEIRRTPARCFPYLPLASRHSIESDVNTYQPLSEKTRTSKMAETKDCFIGLAHFEIPFL
jgi:hypothetical protein